MADLHGRFSGRIFGVIEDTENGHRRHQGLDTVSDGTLRQRIAAALR